MGKIIPFPEASKPLNINWEEIEVEREAQFPKIPKKALKIIRMIFELQKSSQNNPFQESYLMIDHSKEEPYPPDPIQVEYTRGGILWILDLLDRFGGELVCGKLSCQIKRSKKRYPVFLIQKVTSNSRTPREAASSLAFSRSVS